MSKASFQRFFVRRVVPFVAVGLTAAPVLAQGTSMPAVSFPVELASITAAVVAAGTALLLGYFGMKVGFAFAKKLLNRLHRSV